MKKKAAIISYIIIAFNFLYNLTITPYVIKALGQGEYGIYSLSTSVLSYLSLFQFGFSATFIRYYIKFKTEGQIKKTEELNGMYMLIFGIIFFLILGVGILLLKNIYIIFGSNITQEEYKLANVLIMMVVLIGMITVLGVPFQALITANEKFVFQKTLSLIEIITKYLFVLIILILGYKSIAVTFITLVVTCLTFFSSIFYVLKVLKIKFRFTNFDFALFKDMGAFSFFVFLQSIMDIFNWQIDRILIARFWGSKEIAIYSVGSQFNHIFITLTSTITTLFVPKANKIVASNGTDEELSDLMIRVGRPQFVLSTYIFLSFVIFGRDFISFYAGTGYENSYYVALFLMICMILPLSMDLWYHIARAKSKHKTSTTVFAAVAFLNLLISIPLCKKFAEVGAAAGTCIGMILANNIFQIWYASKIIHLNMRKWFKNIIKMSRALILPIVFGIIILNCINLDSIFIFLVWAILFSLVCFVSYWFLALNSEEKNVALSLLNSLKERLELVKH